jgi:hypothetical protein
MPDDLNEPVFNIVFNKSGINLDGIYTIDEAAQICIEYKCSADVYDLNDFDAGWISPEGRYVPA